ncbi:MAG: Mur ligase family protein [bacterium]
MMILVFICTLLKSYRFLQILQLEHYEVKKYLKYVVDNYLYYNILPLVCLLTFTFYENDLSRFIFIVVLYLFLSMSTLVSIVKLKFTNRIIRIYLCLIPLYLLLFVNPILFFLLFEFILLIPFYLNKPIDKKINEKYLEKSISKYNNFNNIKIGITGSYGKTSTKNIINDLLKNYYLGSCSYKSYNTLLGISRYINDIPLEAYDYIVLEYGASKVGDIKEITNYFNPDIACVTEIGYMHLDSFKSKNNILNEKMSLCDNAKVVVLNYEQVLLREYNIDKEVISYGFNYGDYQAKEIIVTHKNTTFDLYYKEEYIDNIKTNLIGRHQVLNLLCAICIMHYLKIDIKDSIKYINCLSNTESRLVYKQFKKYEVLDDSYNANLVGSLNALEILSNSKYNKILITPGYVENKEVEEDLYTKLSLKIIEVNPFVILVGNKQTKILQDLLKGKVEFIVVETFKSAMNYVNELEDYSTILIENDLPDNYRKVI